MLNVNPIGILHSTLKKLEDCPRQESEKAPEATIEIIEEFIEAASHIKSGDTITLLSWLDKADRTIMKTYPRDDPDTELTGVFSTRSPDRPNPIGLHKVKVLAVEGKNKIRVRALEVLDGTPIIDIKSK